LFVNDYTAFIAKPSKKLFPLFSPSENKLLTRFDWCDNFSEQEAIYL